jgi:hypothetical protein
MATERPGRSPLHKSYLDKKRTVWIYNSKFLCSGKTANLRIPGEVPKESEFDSNQHNIGDELREAGATKPATYSLQKRNLPGTCCIPFGITK